MKILALIPARGGSKGLPRKNVLPAGGRPLIAWTIEAALGATCINRVVLSSDDDEIIAAARECGCDVPFRRPSSLATDEATAVDVVLHTLQELPGYDYLVLLQPTSPLRTSSDIDAAFNLMMSSGAPSCVSLCPADESPYWMYKIGEASRLEKLVESPAGVHQRQALPPIYSLNGAIYIVRTDWFMRNMGFISDETIGYVMPRERSIDIDTMDDFLAFQRLVAAGGHEDASAAQASAIKLCHTDNASFLPIR